MNVDMDIEESLDSICGNMNKVKITDPINLKLINDLHMIVNEIVKYKSFDVDIYEICENCSNELMWDTEYILCQRDINWLKTGGMNYFFRYIHSKMPIETLENYNKVHTIYALLIDLFSIQVRVE